MNPLLQRIVDRTRQDLTHRLDDTLPRKTRPHDVPGFSAVMRDGRARAVPALIAEVKPRSPSKGQLRSRDDLDPVFEAYRRHADAVSVLVDRPFFGGGFDLLAEARQRLPHPLLAKGFFVEQRQVEEVAAHGADAVLLIARILDDGALGKLMDVAARRRLEVLIEVHDEAELQRVLRFDPAIVGVNARDLDTFEVDPAGARSLLAEIPSSVIRVAESGLERREDVVALKRIADACLIGTAFMSAPDPAAAIEALGW